MIVTVDGIVAVGKSTMCKVFQAIFQALSYNCQCLSESYDPELLKLYIDDPPTYVEQWTRDITKRKISTYRKAQSFQGLSIIDRSYIGDLAISLLRVRRGEMSQELYQQQVDLFKEVEELEVNARILFTCTPAEALERCKKRSRDGESVYDIYYFEQQHQCHLELISNSNHSWTTISLSQLELQ